MVFVSELVSSIIIAIVQGLTEWIPVSSSGHLVLFERLLDYSGGGLIFDVALHFGTLMAVFVYFGGTIIEIIRDLLRGKWGSENGRLGLLVIVATIPAAIVGYLMRDIFEVVFDSLQVVAMGFAVSGIFLIIASLSRESRGRFGRKGVPPTHPYRVGDKINGRGSIDGGGKLGDGDMVERGRNVNYVGGRFGFGKALLVGIAQIFALFPGISRSGSTMGTGLLLGLREKNAVKFSFLMSIPIIFGANVLAIGNNTLPSELIWATLVSFAVGLLTIHVLYKKILTNRENLRWFGLYALLLSLGLGIWMVLG